MRLPALLCAAVCLVSAAPASAQRDVVDVQLDSAIVLMRNEGFVPMNDPWFGRLDQGGVQELRLDLTAGTTYFVVGVCDNSCSDLDLVLSDASGAEVQADREADDVPMLAVSGAAGGAYTMRVSMATCSASCRWGVRIFSK